MRSTESWAATVDKKTLYLVQVVILSAFVILLLAFRYCTRSIG